MKRVGRTDSGGYLLEATEEEYSVLGILIDTLGGGTGFNPERRNFWNEVDLQDAFSAIRSYAQHRGMANELKRLSDGLIEALEKQDDHN